MKLVGLALTWISWQIYHPKIVFNKDVNGGLMEITWIWPDLMMSQVWPYNRWYIHIYIYIYTFIYIYIYYAYGICTVPPEPSPEICWTWLGFAPSLPGTLSGTFSGTLLNLTGLCTKASWNLLRNLFRNFQNPVEPDRSLHQSLPDLLRNLLRNPVEPKPPRPSPEPSTWPGACTSAHRSYSGLKTPLAYAVGEKSRKICRKDFQKTSEEMSKNMLRVLSKNLFCGWLGVALHVFQ